MSTQGKRTPLCAVVSRIAPVVCRAREHKSDGGNSAVAVLIVWWFTADSPLGECTLIVQSTCEVLVVSLNPACSWRLQNNTQHEHSRVPILILCLTATQHSHNHHNTTATLYNSDAGTVHCDSPAVRVPGWRAAPQKHSTPNQKSLYNKQSPYAHMQQVHTQHAHSHIGCLSVVGSCTTQWCCKVVFVFTHRTQPQQQAAPEL